MQDSKQNQINSQQQQPNLESMDIMPQGNSNTQVYQPSLKIILLMGYLFFIQGIYFKVDLVFRARIRTFIFMPMVYVIFFKLIVCPLMQKYTFYSYGKRKTWIMISLLVLSMTEMFFHNQQTYQPYSIYLFTVFFAFIFYTIALQPLALKQIRIPYKVAKIQIIGFVLGNFFSNVIYLLIVYHEMDKSIRSYITIPLMIIPLIYLHFGFKESQLKSETRMKSKSFKQIFKYFKVFVDPNSRYMRLILFLMIYNLGFSFFGEDEYQLIIQIGLTAYAITRQIKLHTYLHIVLLVLFLAGVSFFFHKIASKFKNQSFTLKMLIGTLIGKFLFFILIIFLFLEFHTQNQSSSSLERNIGYVLLYFGQFLYILNTFIINLLIFQLPISGTGGMFLGILFSFAHLRHIFNFQQSFEQNFSQYRQVPTIIGLTLQIFIICFIPRLYKFLRDGYAKFDQQNQQGEFIQNLIIQQFSLSESTSHQMQQTKN